MRNRFSKKLVILPLAFILGLSLVLTGCNVDVSEDFADNVSEVLTNDALIADEINVLGTEPLVIREGGVKYRTTTGPGFDRQGFGFELPFLDDADFNEYITDLGDGHNVLLDFDENMSLAYQEDFPDIQLPSERVDVSLDNQVVDAGVYNFMDEEGNYLDIELDGALSLRGEEFIVEYDYTGTSRWLFHPILFNTTENINIASDSVMSLYDEYNGYVKPDDTGYKVQATDKVMWNAGGDIVIGDNAVVYGTFVTPGNITVGENVVVNGSLIAGGTITLGAGTVVEQASVLNTVLPIMIQDEDEDGEDGETPVVPVLPRTGLQASVLEMLPMAFAIISMAVVGGVVALKRRKKTVDVV